MGTRGVPHFLLEALCVAELTLRGKEKSRRSAPRLVIVFNMLRSHTKCVSVAMLVLLLTGCAIQMPADPHGTLDRVENGVLRVGVTENPPWVEVSDDDALGSAPSGTEPALISEFAEELGSDIEWKFGSEAVLLEALERGELDVVVGGFLEDTPWKDRGAITRPYTETLTRDGAKKHVMIVRMGENRFLMAVETFLEESS